MGIISRRLLQNRWLVLRQCRSGNGITAAARESCLSSASIPTIDMLDPMGSTAPAFKQGPNHCNI
jgi:hypothetical protein